MYLTRYFLLLPISPLIMQSKRKREAFSDQEQEVCLTPIFASPETTLLSTLDSGVAMEHHQPSSINNANVVPSVESISTVPQVKQD